MICVDPYCNNREFIAEGSGARAVFGSIIYMQCMEELDDIVDTLKCRLEQMLEDAPFKDGARRVHNIVYYSSGLCKSEGQATILKKYDPPEEEGILKPQAFRVTSYLRNLNPLLRHTLRYYINRKHTIRTKFKIMNGISAFKKYREMAGEHIDKDLIKDMETSAKHIVVSLLENTYDIEREYYSWYESDSGKWFSRDDITKVSIPYIDESTAISIINKVDLKIKEGIRKYGEEYNGVTSDSVVRIVRNALQSPGSAKIITFRNRLGSYIENKDIEGLLSDISCGYETAFKDCKVSTEILMKMGVIPKK